VPPHRWHRNRPDGAADETGALATPRDRESGTRGTDVTRRWLIGPSWSGTLVAKGACTPSLHITHDQIPSRQFMLRLRCESGCSQQSRLSTGGHFLWEDQDRGYPWLGANGHPRPANASRGRPVVRAVHTCRRVPGLRAFPMISSGCRDGCHKFCNHATGNRVGY
jgi:hypothetical protein